jgi:predicted permease
MNVVGTVLSIFILLFIGYGTKKVRLLTAKDADLLNTVVLYLTLPAFIFEAIYSYHEPLPWSLAKIPIVGFAMIAVVLAIAYGIGRMLRMDRPTLGGMILAAGFGNTGFLGYPVTQAAFNHKGALVTAVLYDEFAMALPLYTVGIAIAASFAGAKADRKQFLSVFTLPSMIAIPIALILRPITIPQPLMAAIHYMANGTVPLVMISLGLSLSASSLKGYAAPAVVVCVLKLAVLPVITYFAYRAVGVSGITLQAGVLESAMPTAVMSCVLASRFGANGRFVAGAIFVATLISLATIPATLLILGVR